MVAAERQRRLQEAALAAGPEIEDALVSYIGGSTDLTRLAALAEEQREEVAKAILAFQSRLMGSDRARLAELAVTFGMVQDWCDEAESKDAQTRRRALSRIGALSHCEAVRRMAQELPLRALSDPDERVRLEACGLVQSDNPRHLVKAFETALEVSPMIRVQIAPLLRRHALLLCESAIPKALRAGHVRDLVKVLRLLVSWECMLPLTDLGDLAFHPDARVRIEALRVLALLPPTPENRRAIVDNLVDDDVRVCAAAAACVARLKLPTSMPRLTSCLRRGDENLAYTAAMALAGMPPVGLEALRDQLTNPDPVAANAARKALETVYEGRMSSGMLQMEVA
jgi:hypothetical protein